MRLEISHTMGTVLKAYVLGICDSLIFVYNRLIPYTVLDLMTVTVINLSTARPFVLVFVMYASLD